MKSGNTKVRNYERHEATPPRRPAVCDVFALWAFCSLLCFLIPAPLVCAEPALARLSFWVPPERMAEFETLYEGEIAPILERHGLAPASGQGRAAPEGAFSRLFAFSSLSEIAPVRQALMDDPAMGRLQRRLNRTFGRGTGRIDFRMYSAPAGPGMIVPAGPGSGHWLTYDGTDGLAPGIVFSILQDREGYLWFGTGGGVNRYDSQSFTRFTTRDGLVAMWCGRWCRIERGISGSAPRAV